MPKISMLCPVYNREKYLDQAIQSVLNQTYTDFEFILYDDASTDESWQILRRYASLDSRVKIIRGDKNRGSLYVRNELIKIASGEFIAWIDPDDWYDLTFLADAMNVQQNGGYDLIQFGNVARINHNGVIDSHYLHCDSFIYIGNNFLDIGFPYLIPYRFTLWSRLFRSSVLKAAIFQIPEKRYIADDIFYAVPIFCNTRRFTYVDGKAYYYYRYDIGSWGSRDREISLEWLKKKCELTHDLLIHWLQYLKSIGQMNGNHLRVCCENCELPQLPAMIYRMPPAQRAEAEAIFYSYFCEDDRLPNKVGPQYTAYVNRLKFIMQYGTDSIA